MAFLRQVATICLLVSVFIVCPLNRAGAINIVLDYTYDTSNFFGSGNPGGATAGHQARAALEAAASFYSGILADTFSEIRTPDPFNSSVGPGMVVWSWNLNFNNPSTGALVTIVDEVIAADEYRIYAGARSLAGDTLGLAGPGGFGWSQDVPVQGFSQAEINQINQISADFENAVETRGETSGFSRWGGVVTFDSNNYDSGIFDWHFDHTVSTPSNRDDFYSVAIHELAHTLGFGVSDNWNNWVTGTNYTGPAAVAEFGGNIPLDCDGSGCGHWAEGTTSAVLGTTTNQETSLDPTITEGDRKLLTTLDAAALDDIGWSVETPIVFASADYNTDGYVDAADLAVLQNWYGIADNADADDDGDTDGNDYLTWQRQYTGPPPLIANVPEPASTVLLSFAVAVASCQRRRF